VVKERSVGSQLIYDLPKLKKNWITSLRERERVLWKK